MKYLIAIMVILILGIVLVILIKGMKKKKIKKDGIGSDNINGVNDYFNRPKGKLNIHKRTKK